MSASPFFPLVAGGGARGFGTIEVIAVRRDGPASQDVRLARGAGFVSKERIVQQVNAQVRHEMRKVRVQQSDCCRVSSGCRP
jgi:hypothetical protein